MIALVIIITVIVLLALLYILSLRGRTKHPALSRLHKWSYAHRGLHNKPHIPENSLHAFYLALQKGYGIELDVHLLRDGEVAVIHDSTLDRTTGQKGKIEHLTTRDLSRYNLEGTDETIPLFRDVLCMFNGKAPLIVELKTAGGNAAKLCEATFRLLDNYKGLYCVESFDPRCLMWLRKNRPNVCRGQLAQNFLKSTSGMGKLVDFVLTFMLENFLTRPDFIAYKFSDRKNISNVLCRKLWKIQGVSWTLRNKAVYHEALGEGLIPIFEKFEP